MKIEEALNAFEQALDQQFNAMNINDNSSPLPLLGRFLLPTPCSSTDKSENEFQIESNASLDELIVASLDLPPQLPLVVPFAARIASASESAPKILNSYYLDSFVLHLKNNNKKSIQ